MPSDRFPNSLPAWIAKRSGSRRETRGDSRPAAGSKVSRLLPPVARSTIQMSLLFCASVRTSRHPLTVRRYFYRAGAGGLNRSKGALTLPVEPRKLQLQTWWSTQSGRRWLHCPMRSNTRELEGGDLLGDGQWHRPQVAAASRRTAGPSEYPGARRECFRVRNRTMAHRLAAIRLA